MKLRDIEPGWKNQLFAGLGAFVAMLLFGMRHGNDTTHWSMINFQDQLSNMTTWALWIAIYAVLVTTIIYFVFFKLRHKISGLEKRLDDSRGSDGNKKSSPIVNKPVRSSVLGIFIYMALMFSIQAQVAVDQLNVIRFQDQLLNKTILILQLVGFTALFIFIINFFIIEAYYKVAILEKKFGIANTDKENIQKNRMSPRYIGMFLLGLSFVMVLISSTKLIAFFLFAFSLISEVSTRKATLVAFEINTSLIHIVGLSIVFLILCKLLNTIKRIEAKFSND